MLKNPQRYFCFLCFASLISGCATEASRSFDNTGTGYLDPVKQAKLPYPKGPFEGPQTYKVSDLIPNDIVIGTNYTIQPNVINDGFLYIYTIDSKFGRIRAVSTAMLYKRIHEIKAIAEIEKKSQAKEFIEGVGEKGKDVVAGAVNLVTSPIDTLHGAASGVGKLFKRAGENLVEQSRSDAEDNRVKSVIGFAKTKRDYAHDLNVDVYTRNPLLQDALDDLTWSGFAGNLAMSVVVAGLTGPITTATGSTNLMNKVFRDTAPADLRISNRKKLEIMRVLPQQADLFMKNGIFTPREQTLIVTALDSMRNTQNRQAFIEFATRTHDADVAFFRQRQAEMYANYNRVISPISRFVNLGPFTSGLTTGNKLVLCVPLDQLRWTADMAKVATFLTNESSKLKWVKHKELVVGGTLSSMAKKEMTKQGWKISERMF